MTKLENEKTFELVHEGLTLFSNYQSFSEDKMFECFRQAAKSGDPIGEFMLGVCYDNGRGVPADKEEAFRCYQNAANKGVPEAWHNVGVCEMYGEGTFQNPAQAVDSFTKAAEMNLNEALYNLGICIEAGVGAEKNYGAAQKIYASIADEFSPAKDRVKDKSSGLGLFLSGIFTAALGIGASFLFSSLSRDTTYIAIGAIVAGLFMVFQGIGRMAKYAILPNNAVNTQNYLHLLSRKIFLPYSVDFFEKTAECKSAGDVNQAADDNNIENDLISVVDLTSRRIDASFLTNQIPSEPFFLLLNNSNVNDSMLELLRGNVYLRGIALQSCKKITYVGLKYLSECPHLTSLVVGSLPVMEQRGFCSVKKYPPYKRVGNLEIASISEMKKLKQLSVYGCKNITKEGISQLKNLSDLRDLALVGCNGLMDEDFQIIEAFPRLKTLNIGAKSFRGGCLNGLKKNVQLSSLTLSYPGKIKNTALAEIGSLPLLRQLNLELCPSISMNQVKILRMMLPKCDIKTSIVTGANKRMFLFFLCIFILFVLPVILIVICSAFH